MHTDQINLWARLSSTLGAIADALVDDGYDADFGILRGDTVLIVGEETHLVRMRGECRETSNLRAMMLIEDLFTMKRNGAFIRRTS